jgi:hypothetical protein
MPVRKRIAHLNPSLIKIKETENGRFRSGAQR